MMLRSQVQAAGSGAISVSKNHSIIITAWPIICKLLSSFPFLIQELLAISPTKRVQVKEMSKKSIQVQGNYKLLPLCFPQSRTRQHDRDMPMKQ